MLDNTLELHADYSFDSVMSCLMDYGWINGEYTIEGNSIIFQLGDFDHNIKISMYGDYVLVEGDNSHDVVELWNDLKTTCN